MTNVVAIDIDRARYRARDILAFERTRIRIGGNVSDINYRVTSSLSPRLNVIFQGGREDKER